MMIVWMAMWVFHTNDVCIYPPIRLDVMHGWVEASDGDRLSGVQVRVYGQGIDRTEVTDSQGVYNFGELKPGNYDLEISALGFQGSHLKVQVTRWVRKKWCLGANLYINDCALLRRVQCE
ncbi:MAG: carboxypeptidase regulatory-like domain-containing protein [Acidobacteria bacterium]|nr:carboxypeptidase regulatory-like domain-containing protein [Acidobacteriota bacterium]